MRPPRTPWARCRPLVLAGALLRCGGDGPAPSEPDPTPSPPAAPAGLLATPLSSVQMQLSWTDQSPNEDGFRLERCTGPGCAAFAEIARLGAGVTTFLDGQIQEVYLSPATSYSYRVLAYNGGGSSPYSNVATAATPAAASVPAAPSGLGATAVSSSQINLSWTDNANNETGFKIERCSGTGCGNFAQIATVGANAQSYQNTGLSAGTSYSYRVRANNGVGDSPYAGPASATTSSAPAIALSPTTVTFNATAGGASPTAQTVSVSNSGGGTLSGLSVSVSYGAGATGWLAATLSSTSAPSTLSLQATTGSLAAGSYAATVSVSSGVATNSPRTVAVTFAVASAATGPTLQAPVVSGSSISLTWTYPWSGLASTSDGYRLEESTASPTSGFVQILAVNSRVSPYTHSLTRTPGTYYYRVRAATAQGFTPYSEVRSATVTASETEQTFYASHDNLLFYNSSDANVANTVYAGTELSVGCDFFYNIMGLGGYLCAAAVMKFNVQSAIAGRTILEAKLRFYQYVLPGDFSGTFKLAAIGSVWNPATITWNSWQASGSYYSSSVVSFTALATTVVPYEFDVTGVVQNWANGTFANQGFQIWDPDPFPPGYESYQAPYIESLERYNSLNRRPQLYIRYR